MSLASNTLGHSGLFCATTGVDFTVVAASAVTAAERSRSRFVNIRTIPFGSQFVVERVGIGKE
jgi:hypothetical protein